MSRLEQSLAKIPKTIWVFGGAFLIQFFILLSISGTEYFLPDSDDMKFYNDWARRIASGQWSDGKAFYGMPGFAYILGAFYGTFGYDHEFTPFLVAQFNAACHALTATFIFLIGRRVFGRESRGTILSVASAALWVLATPAQVFTAILMPTSWVICGYWGAVLFILRNAQQQTAASPWVWLSAGLVTGVIASTVATILMLLPLLILTVALTTSRTEKTFLRIPAAFLGAFAMQASFSAGFDFSVGRASLAISVIVAVLIALKLRPSLAPVATRAFLLLAGVYVATSPVWLHNRIVAGDKVFLSAHDGLNLYVGNHSEANGYTKIPSTMSSSQEGMLRDSEIIPQKELGRAMKRSEISAYWKEKAHAFMRDYRADWFALLWKKFSNFWNSYQYDDLSILKLLRDEGAVPPGFRFGFLSALGLAGIPFCWKRWPASRWVIGALLLHIASLMPVFITERYRLAAAPGLILIGVGGLAFLHEQLSQRNYRAGLVVILTFAGAAIFCTQSRADAGWALDFYKAGIRATQAAVKANLQNQPEAATEAIARAERNLRIAYAYAPGNADVVFALGNLLIEKNEINKGEACYLRAVAISLAVNPERVHDGALTNLGMLAARRNEWPTAERYFTESLRFDSADAKTWFSLAEAREKQGNKTGALKAVERARQLRPGHAEIEALYESLKLRPLQPEHR